MQGIAKEHSRVRRVCATAVVCLVVWLSGCGRSGCSPLCGGGGEGRVAFPRRRPCAEAGASGEGPGGGGDDVALGATNLQILVAAGRACAAGGGTASTGEHGYSVTGRAQWPWVLFMAGTVPLGMRYVTKLGLVPGQMGFDPSDTSDLVLLSKDASPKVAVLQAWHWSPLGGACTGVRGITAVG